MDRIDLLEAKVKQMIGLVQSLRDANGDLERRLADAEARVRAASDERADLDRERDQVRNRIEQLLGDLEGVAPPAGGGNGDSPPEAQEVHGAEAHGATGDGEGRRAQRRAQNPVLPGLA
jgi:FtsZ-binding cell division protein ZapB